MTVKISAFEKIYWEIRYSLERHYYKKKYSKLPPRIYYDSKYRCYINPTILYEKGCIEYICGELARSGCLYLYCLEKQKYHAHTIAEVFLTAYNKAERFSIDAEDEGLYSRQELELIQKLVEQGSIDRQTK